MSNLSHFIRSVFIVSFQAVVWLCMKLKRHINTVIVTAQSGHFSAQRFFPHCVCCDLFPAASVVWAPSKALTIKPVSLLLSVWCMFEWRGQLLSVSVQTWPEEYSCLCLSISLRVCVAHSELFHQSVKRRVNSASRKKNKQPTNRQVEEILNSCSSSFSGH